MALDVVSKAKQRLARMGLRQVIRGVRRDPEKNFSRLVSLGRRFASAPQYRQMMDALAERLQRDPQLVDKIRLALKNPKLIEKLMVNWALNSLFLTASMRKRLSEEEDFRCPTTLLVDPTSACNLNCPGCWAGEYDKTKRLAPEVLDELFEQMKELGIYWVVMSGGEPLLYPHLVDLLKQHDDMVFSAFTNGTLLDDRLADELAEAANFSPTFSLEGGRETTDSRRGAGVYDEVMAATDRCTERGIPFGVSLTATSQNYREIYSDEFISHLNDRGVMYLWVFHYIPIGRDPDLSLMLKPDQRAWLAERTDQLRSEYPIAVIDFWNDGHMVDGCIAGGRLYAHINASGDVEPCAFVHYATDNIHDVSLKQALKSPLFEEFEKRQPFGDNHLTPCPLIDNPEAMRQMVKEARAKATHQGAMQTLKGDTAAHLDELSSRWRQCSAPLAQKRIDQDKAAKSNDD